MIEFKNVTTTGKGFHLQNISFCLEDGYIMALAGENGAGKTTLLKHILDKDVKYEGKILIDGIDMKEDRKKCLNKIAYVSDEHLIPEIYPVRKICGLYKDFYDNWSQERLEKYLTQLEVPGDVLTSQLSRGEFFRMQIAVGLAHHAKVFLMDEVTSGMDPIFRKELWRLMREMTIEDVDIVLVTHLMDEVQQKCDYRGIMEAGQLVAWEESMERIGE